MLDQLREAAQSASQPLTLKVRFVGGSKDGVETEVTFRVANEDMLSLFDIKATFGAEVYKYRAEDRTFMKVSE